MFIIESFMWSSSVVLQTIVTLLGVSVVVLCASVCRAAPLELASSVSSWSQAGYTLLSLLCHCFYSYDHELVFGVSLKNMNKAERLAFGESLMTHAMTFTAVSEKVGPPACH